jgi:hypothetical protein
VSTLAERLQNLPVQYPATFVVPASIWPELCAVVEAAEETWTAILPQRLDALARRMDEEEL